MKRMFTVIVMLTLGLSGWAMAGPPRHGGPGGPMGPGPELLQTWFELNLNDAQKKQAAEVLKAHRQEILEAREAVREAFEKAREFKPHPGKFDEASFRKGHAIISGAMLEEMVLREKLLSELYAILTPEQQQILEAKLCPPRPPEHGKAAPGEAEKPAPGKDGEPGEHAREGGPEGPGHHGPERGLPLLDAFIKAYG